MPSSSNKSNDRGRGTAIATPATASTSREKQNQGQGDASNGKKIDKWSVVHGGEERTIMTRTSGQFSAYESRKVREAIEGYCSRNNITPARLCSESDNRSDNLRGAWMEISRCLETRSVQSIYRHGLRLMHPFKRGQWSEEETEQLKNLVKTHGKKWAEIQCKLNRSADSCRDKYREYDIDYIKGRWSEEEANKLDALIREAMGVGPEVDMKEIGRRVYGENIRLPWSEISKKMANRSRLSCFKRFQKIGQCGPKYKSAKARKQKLKAAEAESQSARGAQSDSGDISSRSSTRTKTATVSHTVIDRTGTEASMMANSPSGTSALVTEPSSALVSASTSEASLVTATSPSYTRISMQTPNPIKTEDTLAEVSTTMAEVSSDHKSRAHEASLENASTIMSHMPINPKNDPDEENDNNLLNFLASSSFTSSAEVDWSSIRYPNSGAQARWDELLDKYLENLDDDEVDEFCDRPIWEVARFLLSNGDEEQAEIAARTVEAVFSL